MGSRGMGSRGTGSRGVENAGCGKRGVWWKTRGLVENAESGGKRGVWWKTRGTTFFRQNMVFLHQNERPEVCWLNCDDYQFSISAWNEFLDQSKKQSKHFVRKKTIKYFVREKTVQEPKCRALVFFSGVYFSFRGKLRVFFTFEKKWWMCKQTTSSDSETFFPGSKPRRIWCEPLDFGAFRH